jgi:hypothetical protein
MYEAFRFSSFISTIEPFSKGYIFRLWLKQKRFIAANSVEQTIQNGQVNAQNVANGTA